MLPQSQFGFRPGRSTQHSIYLTKEAIKESKKQRKAVLISTRDITRAFDTVWVEGLLYKMSNLQYLDTLKLPISKNYQNKPRELL